MEQSYKKGLERNITLNTIFRTFNKRAYLPLIAVYAVSVAKLSLAEFGLIASLAAIVSLVLEVPSGYLSDRIGHKKALVLGQFMMALAPLGYVFWPNFWGILIGAAGYFGGYAFLSGTIEAFLHETLMALDRKEDYGRVVGRMQAISLLGNVVIIALVPLLYLVDVRLPFIAGSFLMGINFVLTFFLTEPKVKEKASDFEDFNFFHLIGPLWKTRRFILFLVLGMIGASAGKILEFKEIYFQSFDIPVSVFGFIAAAASLLAAAVSYNIHKLERLSENQYYILNFSVFFLLLILAGLSRNAWFGVLLIVLLIVYDRNEDTLTKAYLLHHSPTEKLKATYISLVAFIQAVSGIWIPLLAGYLATEYGIRHGYAYFGIGMLLLTAVLFVWYLISNKQLELR